MKDLLASTSPSLSLLPQQEAGGHAVRMLKQHQVSESPRRQILQSKSNLLMIPALADVLLATS